jgi:WD40 repeat protein
MCTDSTGLYSIGGDKHVKSWDIERGAVSEFIAHDAIIVDCALSPSGLVTLGAEGLVKLWDSRAGSESARVSLPGGIPISCDVIVDQPHWLPVLIDTALCVYDVRKLNEIATFTNVRAQTRSSREASLSAVAFNPSGTRAALCDALGRVCGLTTTFISSRPS